MPDHDSPISLHGGVTIAKAIMTEKDGNVSLPEGTILASSMKRVLSFLIDVILVSSLLLIATGGEIINALNLTLWLSYDFHYSLAYSVVLFTAHWLYWRVIGVNYSRSFGQKMFGIAVICNDGSQLTGEMWDKRSFLKLKFLIPLVNIYLGVYEFARISQRHTHQSNLDLKIGTVVVQANSLPPAYRREIR